MQEQDSLNTLLSENQKIEKTFSKAPPAKDGKAGAELVAERPFFEHAAKLASSLSVAYDSDLQLKEKRSELVKLQEI